MSTPMLDVARELLTDEDAKSAFEDDPEGFLADRGLEDWAPEEVAEAIGYVTEVLPPATAAQLPTADALLGGEAAAPDSLAQLSGLALDDAPPPVGVDTATLDDLGADDADYGAGAGPQGPEGDVEEPEGELGELRADLGELEPELPEGPADHAGEEPLPEGDDGVAGTAGDDGAEAPPDPLGGLE